MSTRKHLVSRGVLVGVLATSLIGTQSTAQSDSNERLVTRMDSAQIALTSKTKLKLMDRHLIPELEVAGAEIIGAGQQISVRYLARAAGSGAPAGTGLTGKGKVQVTVNCLGDAGTETLAKQTLKFDKFGNAATQLNATPTNPCARVRVVRKFKGALAVEAGGTVAEKLSVTPLQPFAARLDGECSPNGTTLCLQQNRFMVEVDFRDSPNDPIGSGFPLPHSGNDGIFYFFGSDNWEMLVKVLDGCGSNDRFWVFASAATTVDYNLRVTDTVTGVSKHYSHNPGTAALAITDTSAFATCP